MMAVNDKIRALRELNNWSQEDMAERLNVSKSSYSRLERDESKLDLNKLEKLAAIFQVDVTELITSEGKGLVCLIGENKGNNTNYYNSPEVLVMEIEKLKLQLAHEKELANYKDCMLAQKDNEIQVLKLLLEEVRK